MSTIVEMSAYSDKAKATAAAGRGGKQQQQQTNDASPEPSRIQFHTGPDRREESGLLAGDSSSGDADFNEESDEIVCRVKKYKWVPPIGFENHAYEQHQGEGSQYLRDFILGVNDGIISTFLVVVGVVSGGGSATTTLLAGISSAVAGAISMGMGEYIATKSQTNVNNGEFALEREHFMYHRDVELEQLRGFLRGVGLEGNLLEAVVSQVGSNDESLMKMMQAFEFGAGNDEIERNPLMAMYTSGRLFMMGSVPTVVPFFFVNEAFTGLWIAAIIVSFLLFGVGAYKTRSTKGSPFWEGFENFMFGVVGTAISYAVGVAFQKANGDDLGY